MRTIFALSIITLALVCCGSTGSQDSKVGSTSTNTQARVARNYTESVSLVTAFNAPVSPAECQYVHIKATPGLVVTLNKWNGDKVVYTADGKGVLKSEYTLLEYSYWTPGSVIWITTDSRVEWSGMSFVSDDGKGATFVNSQVDTSKTHEIEIRLVPSNNG